MEARRPDLASVHADGKVISRLEVNRYLVNPSQGNSRYNWEDKGDERSFMQLRSHYNKASDLEIGIEFLHLVPDGPQKKMTEVIDIYKGKSTDTTSGIIVKKVGCPSFGCGYHNEVEWAPIVLTARGLFPIGTYGVVCSRYNYQYLEGGDIGEGCFIGEMWVTLANRGLAEIYLEALNDECYLNGNTHAIEAEWAQYMTSGKDLPKRGQCKVDKARVDEAIWQFPVQFTADGHFLKNGPGEPSRPSDFVL